MTPTEQKDFMSLARKRFKIALDSTSDNRTDQLDDVKFAAGSPDNNWQWPETLLQQRLSATNPGGPRPCLTINKLPQHIKLVTNEQRQNRPAIKVLPVDDTADVEVAEILNGVIRHIESSSDADVAYSTACENQVTHGEGYFRFLTEYVDENSFDQDIVIVPVENSFAVYLDPDGLRKDPTGSKCEWGFIMDEMGKDDFKKAFPEAKTLSWEEMGLGDEERGWFEGENVRIAEYFCFEDTPKTICLWSDGTTSVKTKDYLPPEGVTLVKERESIKKQCKWYKINGYEILDERNWLGKYIPIVRIVGNQWIVEGKTVVSGIVRNAKDAQRMGNYFESMDTEFIALAPKAPFIGAVGQFNTMDEEWGKANTVPYSRLEYDPIEVNGLAIPPPQRSVPPMASSAIIQAKRATWDNLQATVGQYNPSLGADSQEKSGVAIHARQQQSDVGTYHYVDNLSRGIRFGGRIIVDLIPKIFDTKRIVRMLGLDGTQDHATIDPEQQVPIVKIQDEEGLKKIYNPGVGRYDVIVTVGPGYNSKRQEAASMMKDVLQGNKELMQIMGDLYFKMLDVPGADKIAERIKRSIPPQLTQDENSSDPEAQKQQITQAAQMLGQREAELNAHEQQLQEHLQLVTEQEQKAKEAILAVEKQVSSLNELQAELKSQKEQLKLMEALAAAKLDNREIQEEAKLREAMLMVEKMLSDHIHAVEEALETQKPEAEPAVKPDVMQSIIDSTTQTAEAIREMMKTLTADRETELVTDEQGNPVGSRSKVVMG